MEPTLAIKIGDDTYDTNVSTLVDGTRIATITNKTLADRIKASGDDPMAFTTTYSFPANNGITIADTTANGTPVVGYLTKALGTTVKQGDIAHDTVENESIWDLTQRITDMFAYSAEPKAFSSVKMPALASTWKEVGFSDADAGVHISRVYLTAQTLRTNIPIAYKDFKYDVQIGDSEILTLSTVTFNEEDCSIIIPKSLAPDVLKEGIAPTIKIKVHAEINRSGIVYFNSDAFELVGRKIELDWGQQKVSGDIVYDEVNGIVKADSGLEALADFLKSSDKDIPIPLNVSILGEAPIKQGASYAVARDGDKLIDFSTDGDNKTSIKRTDLIYLKKTGVVNQVEVSLPISRISTTAKFKLTEVKLPVNNLTFDDIEIDIDHSTGKGLLTVPELTYNQMFSNSVFPVIFNLDIELIGKYAFTPTTVSNDVTWTQADKDGDVAFLTDITTVMDKWGGRVSQSPMSKSLIGKIPTNDNLSFDFKILKDESWVTDLTNFGYLDDQQTINIKSLFLGNGGTLLVGTFTGLPPTEEKTCRLKVEWKDGNTDYSTTALLDRGNNTNTVIDNGQLFTYINANLNSLIELKLSLSIDDVWVTLGEATLATIDKLVGKIDTNTMKILMEPTAQELIGQTGKITVELKNSAGIPVWFENDFTVTLANGIPVIDLSNSHTPNVGGQSIADRYHEVAAAGEMFTFDLRFTGTNRVMEETLAVAIEQNGKMIADNSIDGAILLAPKLSKEDGVINHIAVDMVGDDVTFTIGTTDREPREVKVQTTRGAAHISMN